MYTFYIIYCTGLHQLWFFFLSCSIKLLLWPMSGAIPYTVRLFSQAAYNEDCNYGEMSSKLIWLYSVQVYIQKTLLRSSFRHTDVLI